MKLIKLSSDHYIIVDESEIKEGDWMHLQQGNTPSTKQGEIARCEFADANNLGVIWKKITHSTQPLEGGNINYENRGKEKLLFDKIQQIFLSEVKELLGEVDVRKKSDEYSKYETPDLDNDYLIGVSEGQIDGYTAGYNQALEDNKERKYTEKDVIAIVEKSRATGLTAEYIIQSLQPPTSWDVEFVNGKLKLK